MKIVIFVNDSCFSYFLAKQVIEKFHDQIEAVVFSRKVRGSIFQIIKIFKKTYWRYFCYRLFIEFISQFNQKTILFLVKRYKLRSFSLTDVNSSDVLKEVLPTDLGLTFNFEQIILERILRLFRKGMINIHASQLPKDKGISPVLWAFARGDKSVWSTIYKMDGGIDSGPIYRQFEIPVFEKDTVFSLYERVCKRSGEELVSLVESLQKGEEKLVTQEKDLEESYWSWPDKTHKMMMNKSDRKFINLVDILRAFKKNHT